MLGDLIWVGLTAVLFVLTLGLIAVCDPRAGKR